MVTRKQAKESGRPAKFQDIEEFRRLIKAYFDRCDANERPYTVTGLAYALDTNRMTLINIENGQAYGSEFGYEVTKAKMRCELWLEENLLTRNSNVVGSIFALKNNFGWRDKSEQEISHVGDMAKLIEQRRKQVIEQKTVQVLEYTRDSEAANELSKDS